MSSSLSAKISNAMRAKAIQDRLIGEGKFKQALGGGVFQMRQESILWNPSAQAANGAKVWSFSG